MSSHQNHGSINVSGHVFKGIRTMDRRCLRRYQPRPSCPLPWRLLMNEQCLCVLGGRSLPATAIPSHSSKYACAETIGARGLELRCHTLPCVCVSMEFPPCSNNNMLIS